MEGLSTGWINLTHCIFEGAAFASATTADRHEMRARAETVGTAAVWADTTRLHAMGQDDGLIGSSAV